MIFKLNLFLFFFLGIVTIGSVFMVGQYEQNGPGMLKMENWQMDKPEKRVARIAGNDLYISSSDPKKSVSIRQSVQSLGNSFEVQLSADIWVQDVVPGKKTWNKARLLLLQYDEKSAWYKVPHQAAGLEGTRDWATYKTIFKIMPGTTKLKVVAELSRCSGSMELKNIKLYPVVLSSVYTWVQRLILGGWGMFFVFFLGDCLVKGRYWVQGILIISFTAILFATMIPGNLKLDIYERVMAQVHLLGGMADYNGAWIIGNMGHFCFFMVFGLVLSALMPGLSLVYIGANILMLAGGTELVQFYIDGRMPMFTDFLIDLFGGMAGLVSAGGVRPAFLTLLKGGTQICSNFKNSEKIHSLKGSCQENKLV